MSATLKRYCCISSVLLMSSAPAWAADLTVRPVSSTDGTAIFDVANPLDTGISMRPGEAVLLEVEVSNWPPSTLRTVQIEFDTSGLTSGTVGSLTVNADVDADGLCDPAFAAAGLCPFCPAQSSDVDGAYMDICRNRCIDATGDVCSNNPLDPPTCPGGLLDCLFGFADFVGNMAGFGALSITDNPNTMVLVITTQPGFGAPDDGFNHYVGSFVVSASANAEGTFTLTQFVDQDPNSNNGGSFTRDTTTGQPTGAGDVLGQVRINIVPPCLTDADCSDGQFCNGAETCDVASGICQAGTPPVCDDGLFCNGVEGCDNVLAACTAGTPVDCNDNVACTDDSCSDATSSCVNVANDANCDNGLFCDGVETCDAVNDCQAGTPVDCNDNVACTDDSCSDALASCVNTANDANCDDGLFCNGAETCNATTDCQPGTAPDCNDGVGCTDDSCSDALGSCVNAANDANCFDNDPCTAASCDPALDCQFVDVNGNACASDADCQAGGAGNGICDLATGSCSCVSGAVDTLCIDVRGCGTGNQVDVCPPSGDDTTCPGALQCSDGICVDQCCYDIGQTVTIDVQLGTTVDPACGAQLFLEWDTSAMEFVSIGGLGAMNPLGWSFTLVNNVDEVNGTIDLAISLPPGTACNLANGTSTGGTIASFTFNTISTCKSFGLRFRDHNPLSAVGGPNGEIVLHGCNGLGTPPSDADSIQIQPAPVFDCPIIDNTNPNADCGATTRNVTFDPVALSDSCEDVSGLLMTDLCTVTFRPACDGADPLSCGIGPICATGADCASGICVPLPDGSLNVCAADTCEPDGFCLTPVAGIVDPAEVLGGGGDFPAGLTSVSCTFTNGCGLTGLCDFNVENSGLNTAVINIEESPTMVPGSPDDPIVRCVDFQLSVCDSPAGDEFFISSDVVFGQPDNIPGHGTAVLKVPPGNWTCMTATDSHHSLTSTCLLECIDNVFTATFKGSPDVGDTCHWLVQGNVNGDPEIDIFDFTILAGLYLQPAPEGNDSTCASALTDADFNGDGVVTLADFSFIVTNFFEASKDPCSVLCDPGAQAPRNDPQMEVTVRELVSMGMRQAAAAADVDRNGVVDLNDMALFIMQNGQDDPAASELLEAVSNRFSAGMR